MRIELEEYFKADGDIQYHYNFGDVIQIADNWQHGRLELAQKHIKEIEKKVKTEEEFWVHVDDTNWYAFRETFYIWHFCLWRLQAILEGIMATKYIKTRDFGGGLKTKLDIMSKMGYTIAPDDYEQLLKWAKLRNVLSHRPPSSPGSLEKRDITEYHDLCVKVCVGWDAQQDQK